MRTAFALAVASLMCGATAHASVDDNYALYDTQLDKVDPAALESVKNVQKSCAFSRMSRIGPRPEQAARCEKAVVAALKHPTEAARAAFAQLDAASGTGDPWRLYDLIARAGDVTYLEPLVAALEKIQQHGMGSRRWYERQVIGYTLSRISFATPKGSPEIAWRAWLTANAGKSRETMFTMHLDELRQVVARFDGDWAEYVTALQQMMPEPSTHDAAIAAIDARLAKDNDLNKQQQAMLKQLRTVPIAPTTLAQKDKSRI